jgi:hypothetical protein
LLRIKRLRYLLHAVGEAIDPLAVVLAQQSLPLLKWRKTANLAVRPFSPNRNGLPLVAR